jgi:hypothetical protein
MNSLKPIVVLPTEGKIFRVLPDPYTTDWCLEIRNPDTREAHWIWVSGGVSPVIPKLSFENSWAHTLMDAAAGEFVLGQYEAGGMPVISGLKCWNAQMNPLWQYSEGRHFQRSQTGWSIQTKAGDSIEELFRSGSSGEIMPIQSATVKPMSNEILKLLEAHFPEEHILNQLEELQVGKVQILSVFTQSQSKAMQQYLLIVDSEGVLLFLEKIQENLKGFSLDTWTYREGILFYISGMNTWKALSLLELS